MLYLLRKVAGSIATTSTYPPAGTVTPCGNENVMPLVNFQVLAGLAGSKRSTGEVVMLSSSTNSSPPSGGLYISSLIMIGPTRGGELAAPGVGEEVAAKADPPELVYRPRVTCGSAASK